MGNFRYRVEARFQWCFSAMATYYSVSTQYLKSKGQITQNLVNEYIAKESKWSSFEEFLQLHFAVWRIEIDLNSFDESSCNCPFFMKNFVCKHVTGLGIRLKLIVPPLQAKCIPIGQKRKRGRAARAKPALLIQWSYRELRCFYFFTYAEGNKLYHYVFGNHIIFHMPLIHSFASQFSLFGCHFIWIGVKAS